MRTIIAAAAVALVVAGPASAGMVFAAWDGPPMIFTGEGGTHIDDHGIDIWTNGKPAKRFQVLGTIDDGRRDALMSGDALSSKELARKVQAAGGDAVLLGSRTSDVSGVAGSSVLGIYGNTAIRNGGARVIHDIHTRFVVIKYLPS